MGPAAGGFGGGGFPVGRRPGRDDFRVDDWVTSATSSEGSFGRGRPRRDAAPTGPQRGADFEAELHLSFEDAVNGVTTRSTSPGTSLPHLRGSGAAPGTSPIICPRCGGRGV